MTVNRLADYLDHMKQAATKVMDSYPVFIEKHSNVPGRNLRGMRNRIAHGYFEINFEVVWDTVFTALPELLGQLKSVRCQVPV